VITHESGHFLGLAHSQRPDAVMSNSYTPGSITQRTLVDDDKQAICSIYPDRQTRNTAAGNIPATLCNLSPATPTAAAATCGDPVIGNGCSMGAAPGRERSPENGRLGAWLLALGAAATIASRARARSRARHRLFGSEAHIACMTLDAHPPQAIFQKSLCTTFRKTQEKFGGLSNMAGAT